MPELPEVETIRDRPRAAPGRSHVRAGRDLGLAAHAPPRSPRGRGGARGRDVAAVERRGKYLVVRFETGRVLLIHLRMTGGLLHAPRERRGRRPVCQGCRQIRQRIGRRLSRRPAVRHLASARARRARALPRRTARQGAARPLELHREVAHRPSRRRTAPLKARRPRPAASSPASGTSTRTRRSGGPGSIRSGPRTRCRPTS